MMTNFDVIIVGGGPAGYTAAIYTARQKLKTLLLTQTSGGQMVYTDNIENYPGFEKISGVKLLEIFRKQLSQYSDAKIIEGQKAESLKMKDQFFKVTTDKDIMRYDGIVEKHHHIYYLDSEKIEDYFDDELNELLATYFNEKNIPNFKIEDIRLQIIGKHKK